MSRLVIYEGEEQRAEHELAQAVVGLGRHPQNDIVLDDRTLSRFHARIEKRDNGYVVVDLGAQNGVHLNGDRIDKEALLATGDRIDLGRYTAVFQERTRPRSAPRPAPLPASTPTPVRPFPGVGKAPSPKVNGKAPEPAFEDMDLDIEDDLDGDLAGEFDDDHPHTNKGATSHDFNEASQVEYMPPQPTLVLLFNGMEVSRHPYADPELVVGRSKQCDVVISLLGLSRRHSRIFATDEGIAVEDLGSQNGTWVNNERIDGLRVLRHGDLINFYDYGVLFLQDGDVDIGFPGAGFSAQQTTGGFGDDLSAKEPNRAAVVAAPVTRPAQQYTTRSPLADFGEDVADETAMGRGRPPRKRTDDGGGLDLDDLGEGSYLGDEFEDGASKDRAKPSNSAPAPGMGTELIEALNRSRGAADEDLEADIAFSSSANPDDFVEGGTKNEAVSLNDKTTTGFDVAALGGAWPTDDDLERAMMVLADASLMSLEVTLRGKPYTQIPLNQPVMRVGNDPRCEVSMPKSAGLRPWHVTLSQIGSAVLCVRSNRSAVVEIAGKEVEAVLLHSGDTIKIGKVEMKLRAR